MGVVELCHGPDQNSWYLVKKTTLRKYRLVKVTIELNQITVWDANLPLFTNKFSEEFASYTIFSLIDFFSGYN